MEVKTEYGIYRNCFLKVGIYQADGSSAIEIQNREDGPIARLTVCLDDPFLEERETYIDTNNCPWAKGFIEEYNLGKDTGFTARSGYCDYPKFKLNMGEIEKYLEVA